MSCPNGNDIEINDIMRAANTRQLTRFPKVFFFDACRKYYFTNYLNKKYQHKKAVPIVNLVVFVLFVFILYNLFLFPDVELVILRFRH